MDKKVLKERLEEVTNQLRTNAKDVHFFDKLIDEALSLKGQLSVEPIELDCGKKVQEVEGNTYRITLTTKGALYHEYGGYNVFVTPSNKALYETLEDVVVNAGEYGKLIGEEKERMETYLSAMVYCLSLPKIAFSDANFTFDIATKCAEFTREQYIKLMNETLQEETPEEDEAFKNASLAMEEVKEILAEEQSK